MLTLGIGTGVCDGYNTTLQPPSTNQVAWFKFNTGQTVSQWTDQSGLGHHLLQAVGGNQPTISAGTYIFDGIAQFMKCSTFVLTQPVTYYLLMKQLAWGLGNRIADADVANDSAIYQNAATPEINYFAASANIGVNANLAVGVYGVVQIVANGASSVSQIDATTAVTGSPGTASPNGFTLGAGGGGGGPSNIQVKEVIIYSAAHDAATRATVRAYLNTL